MSGKPKKWTPEEWAELEKLAEYQRTLEELADADRKFYEDLMLPNTYSPKPHVKPRSQPVIGQASEVTITKADGTVEVKPAYTPAELDKIFRSTKKTPEL